MPGDIPVGIAMQGAHNIVIRRGEISGFQGATWPVAATRARRLLSAERGDDFTMTDITRMAAPTESSTRNHHAPRPYSRGNAGHYSFWFWALVTAGADE